MQYWWTNIAEPHNNQKHGPELQNDRVTKVNSMFSLQQPQESNKKRKKSEHHGKEKDKKRKSSREKEQTGGKKRGHPEKDTKLAKRAAK